MNTRNTCKCILYIISEGKEDWMKKLDEGWWMNNITLYSIVHPIFYFTLKKVLYQLRYTVRYYDTVYLHV